MRNGKLPNAFGEDSVLLRDGRRIGISVRGSASTDAFPLFWFPGNPCSRLAVLPDDAVLRDLDVRLIVVERPGFGISDPLPNRRILDWPRDVEEVAAALSVETFAVAGFSGGAPYALACGVALSHRISRIAVIGGIAPVQFPDVRATYGTRRRILFGLAHRYPSVFRLAFTMRRYRDNPERLVRALTSDAPLCDQRVLESIRDPYLAMVREALRQGVDAAALDLHLIASPWGFPLGDVRAPVDVWHGGHDRAAPMLSAMFVARELPVSIGHFREEVGHFIHFSAWREIVTRLRNDPMLAS